MTIIWDPARHITSWDVTIADQIATDLQRAHWSASDTLLGSQNKNTVLVIIVVVVVVRPKPSWMAKSVTLLINLSFPSFRLSHSMWCVQIHGVMPAWLWIGTMASPCMTPPAEIMCGNTNSPTWEVPPMMANPNSSYTFTILIQRLLKPK